LTVTATDAPLDDDRIDGRRAVDLRLLSRADQYRSGRKDEQYADTSGESRERMSVLSDGTHHVGTSTLIDLVGRTQETFGII
jgi:hypothetical protein